jgi:hypothetical protein
LDNQHDTECNFQSVFRHDTSDLDSLGVHVCPAYPIYHQSSANAERIGTDRLCPTLVSNPSDNLKNLFEMPIIFYALVLYLFLTKQVDMVYVTAAWGFVLFRTMHSAVHCTFNRVMLRFYLYLCSSIAVWLMAGRAALMHFSQ